MHNKPTNGGKNLPRATAVGICNNNDGDENTAYHKFIFIHQNSSKKYIKLQKNYKNLLSKLNRSMRKFLNKFFIPFTQ